MTERSLQPGDRVFVTERGMWYINGIRSAIEKSGSSLAASDGHIYGTIASISAFLNVRLDRYDLGLVPFHRAEIDLVEEPAKSKVPITMLAELLETYRTSDDDAEVAAAQELLIELYTTSGV